MWEERVIWDKLWILTGILMRKGQTCTALELAADSHLLKFTSEEIEAFCYFPNSPLSLTNSGKVTFSHQAFSFFDNIKDIYEKPSSPFVWESHMSSLEFVNSYLQESNAFALKSFIKHFSSSQLNSSSSQFTMGASPPPTSEHDQVSLPSAEAPRGPSPLPFINLSPSYSISYTVPGVKNIIFGSKPPGCSSQSETDNFASEERPSEQETSLLQRSTKRSRHDCQPFNLKNCNSKIPCTVASISATIPEASDHPAVCTSLLTVGDDALTVDSKVLLQYSATKDGCNSDTDRAMKHSEPYSSGRPVSLLAKRALDSEPKASADEGEENVCSYGLDSSCPEMEKRFTIFIKPETSISLRSDVSEIDGSSKSVPLCEMLDGIGRADVQVCKSLAQEGETPFLNKIIETANNEAPASSANHLISMCPENSEAVIASCSSKHRDLHYTEERERVLPLSLKDDKKESPFCSSCSNISVPENQLDGDPLTKHEKAETQGNVYHFSSHSVYDTGNKVELSQEPSCIACTNESSNEEKTVTMDTEDQLELLVKEEEKTNLLRGVSEYQTSGGQNLNNGRHFKKIAKNSTTTGHGMIVVDDCTDCTGPSGSQTSLVNDVASPSSMKEIAQFVPMHSLKYSPEEEEETDCSPSDSQLVDLSQKCSEGLDKRSRHQKWFKDETLVMLQGKKHVDGQFVDSRKHAINSSTKWDLVSAYCVRHDTERSAIECQKKWNNLCTDFKRVRDYEESGAQSYWGMNWGKRKELKLHTSFDREVYDLMEGLLGRRRPISNEVSHEASVISFDHLEQHGDAQREDVSIPSLGRRKRKDSLSEEELKQQLMVSIDAARATLVERISTQLPNMFSQVPSFMRAEIPDEEKPKENTGSMACVLEKLVHSLGEIAKKL